MYARETSQEHRQDVLLNAIKEIKLAALVSSTPVGLQASHVPLIAKLSANGEITLEGHLARNNAHWRAIEEGVATIAIYQGPHAYISPGFYETKELTGKVVPTWAYIAVHAYGVLTLMDDREGLARHLRELSNHHEKSQPVPWSVDDAPKSYMTSMMNGIIGISMKVDKIEGAWKLNQHRSPGDKQGAVDGLSRQSDEMAQKIAKAMQVHLNT